MLGRVVRARTNINRMLHNFSAFDFSHLRPNLILPCRENALYMGFKSPVYYRTLSTYLDIVRIIPIKCICVLNIGFTLRLIP
jgi:hypothetical protein